MCLEYFFIFWNSSRIENNAPWISHCIGFLTHVSLDFYLLSFFWLPIQFHYFSVQIFHLFFGRYHFYNHLFPLRYWIFWYIVSSNGLYFCGVKYFALSFLILLIFVLFSFFHESGLKFINLFTFSNIQLWFHWFFFLLFL